MSEALPPLPEPFVETDAKVRDEWGHYALFTADQMREYGALCARQAVERAAAKVRSKIPLLELAQARLGADEYGARCCVEGRKQQAEQDAAAILADQEGGKTNE